MSTDPNAMDGVKSLLANLISINSSTFPRIFGPLLPMWLIVQAAILFNELANPFLMETVPPSPPLPPGHQVLKYVPSSW